MTQKIIAKLVPITPYSLYVQRVNAMYDSLRQNNSNYTYVPAQFGGLFGQQMVSQSGLVLEITDFKVT